MVNPILEHFRCPDAFAECELQVLLPAELASALSKVFSGDPVWCSGTDASISVEAATHLIEELRMEHYARKEATVATSAGLIRNVYYFLRPLLGVHVRRLLQRVSLRGWQDRPFPRWPVDRTVDEIHEQLLLALLKQKNVDQIPFIWFWPDTHSACAVMTHDVETQTGLEFCPSLMELDDSLGVRSSFQLIPERRYSASQAQLDEFRRRGFEINIHDLNHDGQLFSDKAVFQQRVRKINQYAERYGARGFRAGALYRNQDWYSDLHFGYDMSVPNVAHLDPQHGGCCTTFPYFIGHILELPVTVIQDYSLFHVIGDYSIDLWKKQMTMITKQHGLINIITHPDYVMEARAWQAYQQLLAFMVGLREQDGLWVPLPGEVEQWWRQRARMRLIWDGSQWCVSGEGAERARVAYATVVDDRLVYTVEPTARVHAASGDLSR